MRGWVDHVLTSDGAAARRAVARLVPIAGVLIAAACDSAVTAPGGATSGVPVSGTYLSMATAGDLAADSVPSPVTTGPACVALTSRLTLSESRSVLETRQFVISLNAGQGTIVTTTSSGRVGGLGAEAFTLQYPDRVDTGTVLSTGDTSHIRIAEHFASNGRCQARVLPIEYVRSGP